MKKINFKKYIYIKCSINTCAKFSSFIGKKQKKIDILKFNLNKLLIQKM